MKSKPSSAGRRVPVTVPSQKMRASSAERGKKRGSFKSKIGPCKCKACTMKREAEMAQNQAGTVDDELADSGSVHDEILEQKSKGTPKTGRKAKATENAVSGPKLSPTLKLKRTNSVKKAKGQKMIKSSPLKENNPISKTSTSEAKSGSPKKSHRKSLEKSKTVNLFGDEDIFPIPTDLQNRIESDLIASDSDDDVTLHPDHFQELQHPRMEEDSRYNVEELTLHRSEMKTGVQEPTIATGDFGFLDFCKEMGGALVEKEPTAIDLTNDTSTTREVIKSRLGSRKDDTPGAVIQWKRGPMLGRGAFGTVWCGLTITGELVAVKQAEVKAMNTEKAHKEYEKIQSEVELLKSLNHPNIVGYLGTCLDGRVVSIFMQYIPGGSVAGILKKFGPLAEPVFARYTRQIVDGVAYLHAKNVIHRDIKGSNLMLMPNGTVKLIDFGCAKKILNLSASNSDLLLSMKGTPYWMAPEVINASGHGPKSDVWCVGCSVFEMALARPPWSHLNKYAALFAISSGNTVPKLSEKFSSAARDFVSKCLIRNPEKRPTAEELLAHPFCRNYEEKQDTIHDSSGRPRNSAKNRSRRL